ncbi:hypothetical protein PC116_g10107 [Phytophthora cactorum]|nr:hypothetical protein Pcac1_g6591 [Phytophthora cactorum]KAG4241968.1 hypothetical protein PC116_g10107 [Phytophthora cactorum]
MAEKARREEEARAAALEVEAGRATQEKAAAADAAHQVNIGHARTRSEKTVSFAARKSEPCSSVDRDVWSPCGGTSGRSAR